MNHQTGMDIACVFNARINLFTPSIQCDRHVRITFMNALSSTETGSRLMSVALDAA
ncbi:MAG: hypothetical protein JKX70_03110 [Phycisphaerales bacterium]|nr:hypothetical protein [Phycisphaerales bacterium]